MEAMEKYMVLEDKLYLKPQVTDQQTHYHIYIPASLTLQMFQAPQWPSRIFQDLLKGFMMLHDVAPGMWSDVKKLIKGCEKCQVLKADNKKPAGKMQQTIAVLMRC